jgi:hypothetical protein
MNDDIPRSADMLRWIPEEHRISEAHVAVEALGAHPLLTEASVKLMDARALIAKWHDSGRPGASQLKHWPACGTNAGRPCSCNYPAP